MSFRHHPLLPSQRWNHTSCALTYRPVSSSLQVTSACGGFRGCKCTPFWGLVYFCELQESIKSSEIKVYTIACFNHISETLFPWNFHSKVWGSGVVSRCMNVHVACMKPTLNGSSVIRCFKIEMQWCNRNTTWNNPQFLPGCRTYVDIMQLTLIAQCIYAYSVLFFLHLSTPIIQVKKESKLLAG